MTVFEVLTKVIGAKELLALVALAKLVNIGEVIAPSHHIALGKVGKYLATVSAQIELGQRSGGSGSSSSSGGMGRWRRCMTSDWNRAGRQRRGMWLWS